ncbi:MAG: hypothetical protein RMJ84_11515 [Sandaracinaceae bacterium]|nr:hypothetical protein [Sandaracinaceae bacterium]
MEHRWGWSIAQGSVLAYLLIGGGCGTAGILAAPLPWKEGAWLEALLKAIGGLLVGSLFYWLACRYLDTSLPTGLYKWLYDSGFFSLSIAPPESWLKSPTLALIACTLPLSFLLELDKSFDTPKASPRPRAKNPVPVPNKQ